MSRASLFVAAFLGCAAGDAVPPTAPPRAPPRERALRFGLSPAHGPDRSVAWGERLARFLTQRLGDPVRSIVPSTRGALVRGLSAGWIDAAWVPPLAYAVARRQAGARPLVRFVRAGQEVYHAAIIVRADSPARGLADLRRTRIGWTVPQSASGYLLARAFLSLRGVDLDTWFASQHFLGDHARAVEAVLERKVDVGATFYSPGAGGAVAKSAWQQYQPSRAAEIRVLADAGAIPSDVVAVRADLAGPAPGRLQAAFLSMHEDPEGRNLLRTIFNAERTALAQPTDYAEIEAMARALGLR